MSKYEILTSEGWKSFDFIHKSVKTGIIKVSTESKSIECTFDHIIETSDGYENAENLLEGDQILTIDGLEYIKSIEYFPERTEDVYDVVNVKDTQSFIANDISVHNCLYWDECSHNTGGEPVAKAMMKALFPALKRTKNAKKLFSNTPNGLDFFHDIWKGALDGKNGYVPITGYWHEIPWLQGDAGVEFKRQTIEEFGQQAWDAEYDLKFLGSSATLVNSYTLTKAHWNDPLEVKWSNCLKVYKQIKPILPSERRMIIFGIDTAQGVGQDSSIIQGLEVWVDEVEDPNDETKVKEVIKIEQIFVFSDNTTIPVHFAEVVYNLTQIYPNAVCMIENNDVGSAVTTKLFYKHEYENIVSLNNRELGIRSTPKLKKDACLFFKEIIESGNLILNDEDTIKELRVFEEQKNGTYSAKSGKHDDHVMSLIWGVYLLATEEFGEYSFDISDIKMSSSGFEDDYDEDTDGFFF